MTLQGEEVALVEGGESAFSAKVAPVLCDVRSACCLASGAGSDRALAAEDGVVVDGF